MSDSLRPHESQHARPPCPSPTPRVHSNSRPLSRWCHPAISSSVVPSSSCPQVPPSISLFQWLNSSHEVAKVLEFQLYSSSVIIAKTQKQTKCPLTDKCIKKMLFIYTMGYYSAVKENEIMPFATTCMNWGVVILREVREKQILHDIICMWNQK